MGIVMLVLLALAAFVEIAIIGIEIATRLFAIARRWSHTAESGLASHIGEST
jgi:hypothetical protein